MKKTLSANNPPTHVESSAGTDIVRAPNSSDNPQLTITRDELLEQLRQQIASEYQAVLHYAGQTLLHAVACGQALLAAEPLVPHGSFEDWIEAETGLTARSGQRYMRLARNLPQLLATLRQDASQKATDVSPSDAELLTNITQTRALRLIADEDQRRKVRRRKRPVPTLHAAEWLTPASIVTALVDFWGTIDLDPCAEVANVPNVPAKLRYTRREDGLSQASTWSGRVFVSPGDDVPTAWVERATDEFQAGRIEEALLLLPVLTDDTWAALTQPYPRAFLQARMHVELTGRPTQRIILDRPYMLIYLAASDRLPAFAEKFGHLTDIYQPFSVPR